MCNQAGNENSTSQLGGLGDRPTEKPLKIFPGFYFRIA